MPAPTRPHDPFNDAPRRPRSRVTHHLQEPTTLGSSASHSLRPTTTASRNLFAASLSRRSAAAATAAGTPANHVLEDPDEGEEGRVGRRGAATMRGGRTRRVRAATTTTETTVELDEDDDDDDGSEDGGTGDVVLRDDRGDYLRQVPAIGEQIVGAEEEQRNEDARLLTFVRHFWASGGGMGGRGSRRLDEAELEKPRADVMARLREAVTKKLADDQWMYEATDYMEDLRIANHGRV
ncbi:hypothetical protein MBLNU459_g5449t1 [Dothideomycetes sp. NU459]